MNMNKLLISTMAAALAMSFAVSAEAAGNKQEVSADVQASCKTQAAKKFSAVHFLKRHNFVNNCVAQHGNANKQAKAKPATEAVKPATTGQAPKQAQ
jgi:BMFP domain-containing protein YqiC